MQGQTVPQGSLYLAETSKTNVLAFALNNLITLYMYIVRLNNFRLNNCIDVKHHHRFQQYDH
jgi:hypothetical protein